MVYVFLGIGFALLLIGSEAVLRGGTSLFRMLGLPPIFINLLIVSLAMSAPELAVVLHATVRGMPDIALGDVVGSNIANMLLVCGIGALMRPMPAPPRVVFRDGGVLIAASFALVFMALEGFVKAVRRRSARGLGRLSRPRLAHRLGAAVAASSGEAQTEKWAPRSACGDARRRRGLPFLRRAALHRFRDADPPPATSICRNWPWR